MEPGSLDIPLLESLQGIAHVCFFQLFDDESQDEEENKWTWYLQGHIIDLDSKTPLGIFGKRLV